MSIVNISPNMLLPVPVPSQTIGPDWAQDIYACLFSQLDAHDHSHGKGVLITPLGLNINVDLSFVNNNAIDLRSARFHIQSAALSGVADLGCIYVSGADLYYNDTSGNQIQITSGGAVNATSSGISSGTNTASFVSNVLVVNAAANTPANIQGGSILLGNNIANSKYLTLAPPNAMAADYGLVLPALPGSTSFVTLDTSGNLAGSISTNAGIVNSNLANATITNAKIATATILGSNIANSTVARANQAAVGQVVSNSSGTYGITSVAPANVTNLSNSYTVSANARPVVVTLISDGNTSPAFVSVSTSTGGTVPTGQMYFLRDGTVIAWQQLGGSLENGASTATLVPPGSFYFLDVNATAGAHTYSVQVSTVGATLMQVFHCMLVTYEL